MVPNTSKLADGIITSNTTTIAIHKLSDSRSAGGSVGGTLPRPPVSPRTLIHSASVSGGVAVPNVVHRQPLPNTVHSLPRKLKSEHVTGETTVTLEALGDSIQTLGRGRPHLPLPSILVSSTSSGRSSAEPTSSSSRRSSNLSDFRLSSALNGLDLDNLDLRNIDPVLASKLLTEIRNGADVGPLLEKLKNDNAAAIAATASAANPAAANKLTMPDDKKSKQEKMVTFQEDTKPGMDDEEQILKADDVFM